MPEVERARDLTRKGGGFDERASEGTKGNVW